VPIGAVLIAMRAVSEAQIRQALQIQQEIALLRGETDQLGRRLIERNLVTPSRLQLALADHKASGVALGEALVARGYLTELALERFLRAEVLRRGPGAQR
jgi:hypothetical protein